MKCIKCGVELLLLEYFSEDPARNVWGGGLVEWVAAGYGSRHDLDRFLVCLCDDCLDGMTKEEAKP